MQSVRDNSVKMLSVLAGHADHIRDGERLEHYQTWQGIPSQPEKLYGVVKATKPIAKSGNR